MKKTRSQNVAGPARVQKTLLLSFQLSKTRALPALPSAHMLVTAGDRQAAVPKPLRTASGRLNARPDLVAHLGRLLAEIEAGLALRHHFRRREDRGVFRDRTCP